MAVEARNATLDRIWRYALLILGAAIFIFPLLFMVMSSLKPGPQLLADTSSLRAFLPVGDISLDNYFANLSSFERTGNKFYKNLAIADLSDARASYVRIKAITTKLY